MNENHRKGRPTNGTAKSESSSTRTLDEFLRDHADTEAAKTFESILAMRSSRSSRSDARQSRREIKFGEAVADFLAQLDARKDAESRLESVVAAR